MKISATVVTYNEEAAIERCLKSLSFCGEIIIVDSKSTDKTTLIARKYTKKIYPRDFDGFSGIKNHAIEKASGEWILSLDADEEISPALKEKILSITADKNALDGYRVKRADFFLGREIKHCGWDRDYQLRLFKKAKGRFDGKKVHEAVEVKGTTGKIHEIINHYSYPDSLTYFNKMNKYTSMQADEKIKGLLPLRMLFAPFMKFFRMYFLKAGFLDGLQGFVLSVYSGFSEFVKFAKMYEAAKAPGTRGILLRAPNWIGDAVMMTMVLKEAKRLYGKVFVAVSGGGVKAVLEKNPYIDKIIQYDRKSPASTLKAAAELKKERISAGISFSPSLSSNLFLMLSGVRVRAGYADDLGSLLLHESYKRDKTHKREHVTEEYKKLMYLVNKSFDFSGAAQELTPGTSGKPKRGMSVLVAPFAKFGPSKMWPVEYYAELMLKILEKYKNAEVIITGLKEDMSFVLPEELVKNKRFVDLRGASLEKVMNSAKNAALFIGNDSGIMHIADAFKTPMIVIYGSTAPYWGGPTASKQERFYTGLECQPCFEKTCRYGHYNCLKSIKVEDVFRKVTPFL